MDIFFADPDAVPVPPDEMEILTFEAQPYPDGRRVALKFRITPFQRRPNIEIALWNAAGQPVAQLSVVEAAEASMDVTIHIREPHPHGEYRARMRLFYADLDSYTPPESGSPAPGEILEQTGRTVASREINFRIGNRNE